MMLRLLLGGRLVKDTSVWSNKREALDAEQAALRGVEGSLAELDEQGIAARIASAAAARDDAQAELARHAAEALLSLSTFCMRLSHCQCHRK